MLTEHADSPHISHALHTVAESAYDGGRYSLAIQFFKTLLAPGIRSPYYAVALSGTAWSEFESGNFQDSAKHFDEFVKLFPKHELASAATQWNVLDLRKRMDLSLDGFLECKEVRHPSNLTILLGCDEHARDHFRSF